MKNKFKLLGMGSLTAALLIPFLAFTQSPEQKKTRHIRMVKVENGKKMEIDTVLNGDDVFIWNGDTLNPEKHIKKFSPSEFDKRHPEKVHKMIMHADSGEDVRIITEEGDTAGQRIIIHKMRNNGEEKDRLIYLDEARNGHFQPVPGVPPVPHIRRFKGMNNSKMINLNDPNVISFKKKDIGGGREKIEIIRKKTNESDNMDFDMEMDHLIDVPAPPMAPEMNIEIERSDRQNMRKEKSESDRNTSKENK